jgi:Ca2+-transporting ATPase
MATFFLLSTGAADVLIILTALVAGWSLPLLPAQILWCNVVTNGIQDVALGFEPGDRSLAQRPPRPPREGVLNRTLLWRLAIVGGWIAIGVIGVFAWQRFHRDADLTTARTATLTTLVLFQMVHVFNCRGEDVPLWRKSVLRNRVLFVGVIVSLAVHIAALYIPWTQRLLDITPIDLTTWLVAFAIASTVIIPNELHKAWTRRRRTRNEKAST